MRRSLRFAPLVLLFASGGCAALSSGGGGGGGADFLDCYSDYCVGYDTAGLRRLYLRTPAGPAGVTRGRVVTAAGRNGSTQVVTRGSSVLPAAQTGARMRPIPARPSSPSPSGGRRP